MQHHVEDVITFFLEKYVVVTLRQLFVQNLLNRRPDDDFGLRILVPILDQHLGMFLQQPVQEGLGQLDRLQGLFLTVNIDIAAVFARQFVAMPVDKLGRLDEHPAGTAGRIKDPAAEGFDDLHHQTHHRARRKELAAALPLGHGKIPEKILVDLAEDIPFGIPWNVGEIFQELGGDGLIGAGQAEILILRKDAAQFRFILLEAISLSGFSSRVPFNFVYCGKIRR